MKLIKNDSEFGTLTSVYTLDVIEEFLNLPTDKIVFPLHHCVTHVIN